MLTICIPTYNRNDLLNQCLSKLLPQLSGYHRLIIIDNCSDVPVLSSLGSLLDDFDETRIRIIRNVVNVGGSGNVLRCLELCETQWMYCLGDDDMVAPDCIATIEKTITTHADALYISFSRVHSIRQNVVRTEGMSAFIDKLDDWSSFLFMSTAVVNSGRMREFARWGYLYAYAWAPFQAILIKILNGGGVVVFSDAVICIEETMAEETWIPFPVAAGKMVLPELVNDEVLRPRLARRLMAQPGLISLIYWARVSGKDVHALERNKMFVKLYLNRCEYYVGCLGLLPYKMGAFILLNPSILPNWLFKIIETMIFKILGRSSLKVRRMNDNRS